MPAIAPSNHVPHIHQNDRYSPWSRQIPTVVAEMGYLKASDGNPFTYMYDPPTGIERQNCEF